MYLFNAMICPPVWVIVLMNDCGSLHVLSYGGNFPFTILSRCGRVALCIIIGGRSTVKPIIWQALAYIPGGIILS